MLGPLRELLPSLPSHSTHSFTHSLTHSLPIRKSFSTLTLLLPLYCCIYPLLLYLLVFPCWPLTISPPPSLSIHIPIPSPSSTTHCLSPPLSFPPLASSHLASPRPSAHRLYPVPFPSPSPPSPIPPHPSNPKLIAAPIA